jgi:hypothetical protein
MKHIKKWQSINESGYLDEFYKEIEDEQFQNETLDRITFNEQILSNIKSIFDDGKYEYRVRYEPYMITVSKYPKNVMKAMATIDIVMTDDEWFYVMFRLSTSKIRKVIPSGRLEVFYKCDQFEGFLKLLKDIKFI